MFFGLQSQAYEFQFGLQYAWTMCIVAVSMTYSITCPIIMPFGKQITLPLPSSFSPAFSLLCLLCLFPILVPRSPLLPASPMQTVWICCCSPRHSDTVSCEPDAHSAPVSAQSSLSFYLLLQSNHPSERTFFILRTMLLHDSHLGCFLMMMM